MSTSPGDVAKLERRRRLPGGAPVRVESSGLRWLCHLQLIAGRYKLSRLMKDRKASQLL
jgi:hypothetical protein